MQVAKSILLIEEDAVEANLVVGMLSESGKHGFSVQHVRSLADGLDLLNNHPFDCILVDLTLPDSQGLETALVLRKAAKLTPLIVFTTQEDEEVALEALRLDIQDYLVKWDMNGTLLVRSIYHSIERKRVAQELRESEERFASFMRHLPAAAWMKDLQGRYVYANAEAERIFAKPLAELLGKTDRDLFPLETAQQFSENDCRVLSEGGSLETTEVLRQADGIEHHSIVNKFTVNAPDGRPAYIAGVALDITERKRTEQALRESEEKFAKIFDTVPVGITISTLADGRFVGINREGEFLSGFRREEVIGRSSLEFDIWKDSAERDRAIKQLRKEGVLRGREMMFRTKQGDVLRGLFSAIVIEIGGKPHLLSIVSDITEQKKAEEEVERLNTDLSARALELENANLDLEAFNYTVAHDLRQPLNVINGYCQAIKLLCGNRLDEECTDYLKEAYNGTLRMDKLIDALLKFSHTARAEMHRETVDLTKMVEVAVAELRIAEPERRITFRIAEGIGRRRREPITGGPGQPHRQCLEIYRCPARCDYRVWGGEDRRSTGLFHQR